MIKSPRDKRVTNILRTKEGGGLIQVDDVFLLRSQGVGSPFHKIPYWTRELDTAKPPKPKFSHKSFAIIPAMTDPAVNPTTRGYRLEYSNANALYPTWHAFNRLATNEGTFGTSSPVTIWFPEPRTIRGWAMWYYNSNNGQDSTTVHIEGRVNDVWTDIVPSETKTFVDPYNYGLFESTNPFECTAVRITSSRALRSCQLFEAEPLVPIKSFNTGGNDGVILEPGQTSSNLYQCFRYQASAVSEAIKTTGRYTNSNKGYPSSDALNRFVIEFSTSKTVCGFSVGGLASLVTSYRYVTCLLIEGRADASDGWQKVDEVDFTPSAQLNRYFDFPFDRVVRQLRITVQSILPGSGTEQQRSYLYLPPMQVWGA